MNLRKKCLQGLLIAAVLVLCAALIPTQAKADTYGDFVYTTVGNEVTITDYTGAETGHLTIPAKIDGKFVTAIDQGAFDDSDFSGVTIPDRVTSIGADAFRGCHSLETVGLPQLLASIGDNAFAECSALTKSIYCNKNWETNVTVGSGNTALTTGRQEHNWTADHSVCTHCKHAEGFTYGNITRDGKEMVAVTTYSGSQDVLEIPAFYEGKQVQAISDNACSRNTAIKQVILPEGFLYIGDNAFYECRSLEQINFFDTIYYIGTAAFRNTSIKIRNLPAGLKAVNDWSFAGTKVERVTVPAGVKSIGAYAFENCDNLTTVNLTTGLESIGERAFGGCGNLVNITFPNGLKSIGKSAFEACGMESVSLPDSLTDLGMFAFDACYSLKSVRLPAGLTVLEGWVFDWCTALETIELPESLTAIGDGAFSNTGLKTVTIPVNVKTIGEQAFVNCRSLKQVNMKTGLTTIGREAFAGCSALEKAVYCGSRAQWDAVAVGNNNYTLTNKLRMHDHISGVCTVCGDTLASYVVEFKNWNGDSISRQPYYEGETVVIPADPTRPADETYSYTFAGWDSEVVRVCNANATYTATYTSAYNEYTVTFQDWDGAVLSTNTYHWGDAVTKPADPSRASDGKYSYTFNGWGTAVSDTCNGTITYTAQYTSVRIGYKVVFLNYDGTEIAAEYYGLGDTVVIPADPTRPTDDVNTYTFAGWDKAVVTVCNGEATYTATYNATKRTYTVTFADWDGAVLSTATYHWGDTVVLPVNPTRAGDQLTAYTFNGWGNVATLCAGNATYTATYTAERIGYEVTFKNPDGTILETKIYAPGEEIIPPAGPTMAADNTYTYTFTGWDAQPSTSCDDDYTYTAQYDAVYIEYTVTFENWDGTVISEAKYHWGDTVVKPADPTRPDDRLGSYTFAGWNKEVTATCQGNAVYAAKYDADYVACTITFKDWDGTVISAESYLYGDKIQIPAAPTRESDHLYTYSFGGWDKAVVNCDGEATYTATYISVRKTYTVTFLNYDGTVISTGEYLWDARVTIPENPVRPADNINSYTFSGWDKEIARSCEGDATYTAQYTATKRSYTVVFKNWDGSVLSSAVYNYGDTVTVPETPIRPDDSTHTYTFSGWDTAVTACMGDATYTAQYTAEEKAPANKPCTDILVNVDTVVLEQAGAEATITVTLSPADTDDVVSFRSENATIATVDANGKIVAVSAGTTKIIITCGDIVKECTVVCDIQTGPTDPSEPEPTVPSEPDEPSYKGGNTNHKRLIGVIIILLASLLGLIVIIFLLRKDREKEN